MYDASKQVGEPVPAKRFPLISPFAQFPKVGDLAAYGPNDPIEAE